LIDEVIYFNGEAFCLDDEVISLIDEAICLIDEVIYFNGEALYQKTINEKEAKIF
jgi:hypothetical protein